MAQSLKLELIINADGTAAVTGLRQVAAATQSIGQEASAASAGTERLGENVDAVGQSGVYLNNLLQLFERLGASLGDLARLADEWNGLQARIRLASDSAQDYQQAMTDVVGISQRVGADVLATGDLYATLAKALKSAGNETASAAQLTETISQAMAISGRSAAENAGALRQLSQALGSGTLRGDEFNSIMENAPRLQQALADALHVTTGRLREMAEKGLLTDDTITQALSGQAAKIAAEFNSLPDTIGRATTRLKNEFQQLVGSFDDTTHASGLVASAIGGIAQHLDSLAGLAAAAGLVAVATAASGAAASVGQYAVAARLAAQETALAAAQEADAALISLESAAARTAINSKLAASAALRAEEERAAAIVAEQAARRQLSDLAELMVFDERRAAAERQLQSAILARAEADAKASGTASIALGAQRAAAEAAANLATANSRAAEQMGGMARAGSALKDSLEILKNPLNALIAAEAAVMAYDVGAHLRKIGLDMGFAAEQGSVLAQVFHAVATEGEISSRNVIANQEKIAAKLKQVSEATGVTVTSMADLNRQAQTGTLVFNEASGAWERGTVSLTAAATSMGKLEALYKTQLEVLSQVAKQVEGNNRLQEAKNALAVKSAEVLGTEQDRLTALVQSRQSDVASRQKSLSIAAADLQKSQELLDQQEKEIAQLSGPLPEARAKDLAALKDQVAEKGVAVEVAKVAVESAQLEVIAAQNAATAYGDQSAKLAELREKHAKLSEEMGRYAAIQAEGKQASAQLAEAQADAASKMQEYLDALAQGRGNIDAYWQAAQTATARVTELKTRIDEGAEAAKKAAPAKIELAKTTAAVSDASKDYQQQLAAENQRLDQQVTLSKGLVETKNLELQRRQEIAKAQGDGLAATSLQLQMDRAALEVAKEEASALHDKAENQRQSAEQSRYQAEMSGTYQSALKGEIEAQLAAATALEQQALKMDAANKLTTTQIALSAQQVDAQKAVNEVVKEYARVSLEGAAAAQKVGEAAIAAGDNQYDAAEKARQAAKSAQAASEAKAKADREAVQYTDQIAAALGALADQYAWLGDSSEVAWLRSKEALGQFWQAWEKGQLPNEFAALEERLKGIGQQAQNIDALTAALQAGAVSAKDLAEAESLAKTAGTALGEERLQTLRDSIADAKQRIEDLKSAAEDTLKSWQDKLDQLNGNELAVAERQRIADLADLQAQLNAAVEAGNTAAAASIRDAINAATNYWATYIAGLKAADQAASEANLPGITDNGDGTISGTLPTTNTGGGGSSDGGVSGAMRGDAATTTTSGSSGSSGIQQVSRLVEVRLSAGGETASLYTDEELTDKVLKVLEAAQKAA